jgi:hypothetical protein
MSVYSTSLQCSVRWYRKLAMEIVLSRAVIYAHCCYKKIGKQEISITKFMEEIFKGLLDHMNCEHIGENRIELSSIFKEDEDPVKLEEGIMKVVMKRK